MSSQSSATSPIGTNVVNHDLEHFRLFDLPQELQDEIFALAYPREGHLTVSTKRTWECQKDHHRKLGRQGPYLSYVFVPKINEWLVSKRYLRIAAKAWMGAQSFSRPVNKLVSASNILLIDNCGLFIDYATEASVVAFGCFRRWQFKKIAECRSLRILEVEVGDNLFDAVKCKLAWTSSFTDAELMEVVTANGMVFAPGLQGLHLQPPRFSSYMDMDSAQEKATFASNLKRLERLAFDQRLQKSHDTHGASDSSDGVLYHGSRVRYKVRYDLPPSRTCPFRWWHMLLPLLLVAVYYANFGLDLLDLFVLLGLLLLAQQIYKDEHLLLYSATMALIFICLAFVCAEEGLLA